MATLIFAMNRSLDGYSSGDTIPVSALMDQAPIPLSSQVIPPGKPDRN
jgi:hypothetical protein